MKPLSILLFLAMFLWQCQSADQSASASSTPDRTMTEPPGQPATTALAENSDGPRITFDKVRHHFGSIWHAEKVTYAYTFTNSGTEPPYHQRGKNLMWMYQTHLPERTHRSR